MNRDITTLEYWDCECEENYINSKFVLQCPRCGVDQEDGPDSLIEEVKRQGLPMIAVEPELVNVRKSTHFTNFPNILYNLDHLADKYNPEHDCGGDVDFTWVDAEILGIISKLVHEVRVLEERVHKLETGG